MAMIKILTCGDVVGKPGRKACREVIPRLIKEQGIHFVIVNGENLAGGSGITQSTVDEIFRCGVDVISSGDHVFKKKEGENLLQEDKRILRPANYPALAPGQGSCVVSSKQGIKIGVINLLGRVFLKTVDCPFQAADREIEKVSKEAKIIFVDMHAEATSEKVAMGWYLDGRVSGIFGTHTHVQTADECVLPKGTGYITELGMCGPYRSVIGREIEQVHHMFLTQMPVRLDVATEDARLSGAIFEIDTDTGKAVSVTRVHERAAREAE